MKIKRILWEGAENGYANLNFSNNDKKLVSISSRPDFLLCIWDIENEI